MDIQQLIEFDQQLLLKWNGSTSLFWDGFMWVATSTYIWTPVAIALLYVIFRNNKLKEALLIIGMIGLVITLADQISSGICKPFFARFRPTQDPDLMYMIDIVNDYRGGRFGFTSSHAANTFSVAVFVSLLMRSWSLSITMILWAALNAYSRIYLGVHYPGDILFGTLTGIGVGVLVYILYHLLKNKFLPRPQYISNQYTSSGYLTTDISLLLTVMTVTVLVIVIYGMILGNLLNF